MPVSPQTHETVAEEVRLNLLSGSDETQDNNNESNQAIITQSATSRWDDKHHRKLAICSIICGISCIGIKALINSVKAEEKEGTQQAALFSQRAKRFAIISIVTWVAILALTPVLIALFSYLLTLRD